MDEKKTRIEAGKRAVLAQVDFFHREFGRVESNWKSDGTRVTPADIAISEGIFSDLRSQFPLDDFCSEEVPPEFGEQELNARFAWVLDPVDGTNNYALGLPYCAISLALLEDGMPVYGIVYDMARRVLMHGGGGMGMMDGEIPRQARQDPLNPQSLIGFHSPFDEQYMGDAEKLIERFKIRGLGSSTLHFAYVASGLLDGVVDHNVRVWDIAAAYALCEGAGAEIHFMKESPFPLKRFSVKLPRIQFYAGGRGASEDLRVLLEWEN